LGFILALIGFAVYLNSLSAPFTFDDDHAIVITSRSAYLHVALADRRGSPLAGRPLVSLSFAVNYALGGSTSALSPRQRGIHVICALLLFGIARRHLETSVAFAIALIWMVHRSLASLLTTSPSAPS